MKKITEELRYDGATIEQVHQMLADPAFREQVCDAQHVLRRTVAIQADQSGMTVEIDQVQATQGVPGFAKKFVGEELQIVQTEDWTSPAKGNIYVAIPGKPGEISGTALVTEDPQGTTETVNLSVKVNIPLVGSKMEGLVAEMLSRALREEHRVGQAYLAARG